MIKYKEKQKWILDNLHTDTWGLKDAWGLKVVSFDEHWADRPECRKS